MKLALEARIAEKIAETSDLIPWMVRHAAMLVNIGQRGGDGRTAWERVSGRKSNREVPELGGRIMFFEAQQSWKG